MRDFVSQQPSQFIIRTEKPHGTGRYTHLPSIGNTIYQVALDQMDRELAGRNGPHSDKATLSHS
jgi:hypothetical protein